MNWTDGDEISKEKRPTSMPDWHWVLMNETSNGIVFAPDSRDRHQQPAASNNEVLIEFESFPFRQTDPLTS